MDNDRFHQLLLERLDRMDDTIDKMETQVVDRFDGMDATLESINNRLREVEIKVGKLEERKLIIDGFRGWIAVAISIAAVILVWLK